MSDSVTHGINYEDLRKKKYLDEEELKDYLVDRFENYKIRVKK